MIEQHQEMIYSAYWYKKWIGKLYNDKMAEYSKTYNK